MGASRGWHNVQNATVFSQRNKADPNWALSEGLSASVDIIRVGYRSVLWSFYASENLGVFISMWFSVGSEDAPLSTFFFHILSTIWVFPKIVVPPNHPF